MVSVFLFSMKRFLLLVLIAAGCSPVYLVDKKDFSLIPKGSTSINVGTTISPDSAFKVVAKEFTRGGWVVNSNKDLLQLSAEPKSVGSGTALKPIVNIDKSAGGTTISFRGEWGLDQQGQIMMQSISRGANISGFKPVIFEGKGTTKNDVAFQSLVVIARKIQGDLTYSKD